MIKKIFSIIGIVILFSIVATYFILVSDLKEKGDRTIMCQNITVTILDSLQNRFVSKKEVKDILISSKANPLKQHPCDLNLSDMENLLNKKSAIKFSDVSVTRDGKILVDITQRRPVLRIETRFGGFYVDDTNYIFPLVNTFTSYVPIICGHIPIKLSEGYRGETADHESKWLNKILKFGKFLDNHEFWNAQIQQIYIEKNQDLVFYTRVGNQKIIFGQPENIEYKFNKLNAYYHNIVPNEGWNKFKEINLKYSNQIICTENK